MRGARLVGGALALAVACAHAQSPNERSGDEWNKRVGNYTYDKALSELGPPTHEKTLTRGGRVCEWQDQRSTARTTPPETSYGSVSPGLQHNDLLILTFDGQNVLVNCSYVTQPPSPKPDAGPG